MLVMYGISLLCLLLLGLCLLAYGFVNDNPRFLAAGIVVGFLAGLLLGFH